MRVCEVHHFYIVVFWLNVCIYNIEIYIRVMYTGVHVRKSLSCIKVRCNGDSLRSATARGK